MCSVFMFWLTYKLPLLTHNFCFLFSLQGPWPTSGLPITSAPIPLFWLIQPLFFKIGPLLFLRGDSRGLFWLVPTSWPVWWFEDLETKPWTKICPQELPRKRVNGSQVILPPPLLSSPYKWVLFRLLFNSYISTFDLEKVFWDTDIDL